MNAEHRIVQGEENGRKLQTSSALYISVKDGCSIQPAVAIINQGRGVCENPS
jgi:hypothetical protein